MQLLIAVLGQLYETDRGKTQSGQSTVEYIIVTLAAATLAIALVKFMNGVDKLTGIFNKILDSVLGLF